MGYARVAPFSVYEGKLWPKWAIGQPEAHENVAEKDVWWGKVTPRGVTHEKLMRVRLGRGECIV